MELVRHMLRHAIVGGLIQLDEDLATELLQGPQQGRDKVLEVEVVAKNSSLPSNAQEARHSSKVALTIRASGEIKPAKRLGYECGYKDMDNQRASIV